MSAYEFAISLRIRHPDVDPDEITRALALEPQHMWRAGEQRHSPTGETLDGTYRESFWVGGLMDLPQLSSDPQSIEGVLLQTLTHLRRSQQFLCWLKSEGGEAELYISIFGHESFAMELSADLLSLLAKLGLSVAFDVHPQPERTEDGDADPDA